MNKIFLIFTWLLLLTTVGTAAKVNSPANIITIMQKSKIQYEIASLVEPVSPQDLGKRENSNKFYRVRTANGLAVLPYQIKNEAQKHLKKGEELFFAKKYPEARALYKKVLEIDPSYFVAMTYTGQTYEKEENFDEAILWYKKAIENNYIDYMAHWFLADNYIYKMQFKEAMREITIALILNRNHANIKKILTLIYNLNNIHTADWTFTPQIKIYSENTVTPQTLKEKKQEAPKGKEKTQTALPPGTGNKVTIETTQEWLAYALPKAVWRFEPGYKKAKGVKEGEFSILEEKEALFSLYSDLLLKDKFEGDAFKALKLAYDKKWVNEFLFFEIILIKHPYVAYELSQRFIEKIADYIIAARGKR
ncbi:MAG: tetratricopeptide repeat protein [bacterium]|nr:tetratricopeptide repeat protein [bacterium]